MDLKKIKQNVCIYLITFKNHNRLLFCNRYFNFGTKHVYIFSHRIPTYLSFTVDQYIISTPIYFPLKSILTAIGKQSASHNIPSSFYQLSAFPCRGGCILFIIHFMWARRNQYFSSIHLYRTYNIK